MSWSLRWRRRTAGIALFAILLNALAPAITHARAAVDRATNLAVDPAGIARAQVCTAAGLVVALPPEVPAATDPAPGDPRSGAEHGNQHDRGCPFCGTHAGSFLLHDARPAAVPPTPPQPVPRALPPRPDLYLSWPAHLSRGPPLA